MLTPEPPRAACTHSVEVPSCALSLALPIVSSTGAGDIAFRERSTWRLAPVVLGPRNRGFQSAPNAARLHTLEITALHNSELSLSPPCFTAVHGEPSADEEGKARLGAAQVSLCSCTLPSTLYLCSQAGRDAHPVQTEAF